MTQNPITRPRYISGYGLIAPILFSILLFPFILGTKIGYKTGRETYQEYLWFNGATIFIIVGFALVFTYFLFCSFSLDRKGVKIFSHYSIRVLSWDDIQSISFIIANKKKYVPGTMIVGPPIISPDVYYKKTRMIRISFELKNNEEIFMWARLNLGHVNEIFEFLVELSKFHMQRTKIDFSEYMGKKYFNPERTLWKFEATANPFHYVLDSFYILDLNGSKWDPKYSKNGKIYTLVEFLFSLYLIMILYVSALNLPFSHSLNLIWGLFLLLAICLIVDLGLSKHILEFQAQKNFR